MHVSQRRVSNRSRPRVEVVGQLTGSELRGGSESSGEDVQHMYVSPGEPSTRRVGWCFWEEASVFVGVLYALYALYALSSLDTEEPWGSCVYAVYRTSSLCLCCLCNKLARHWFTPKTSHTEHAASSGHPRELPGSLPGPSRWEKRPGRMIWSCTSHPHAHLHAHLGLNVCVYAVYGLCCLCNKLA